MKPLMVDSSFWIGLACQKRDPLAFLNAASHGRELAICGVVRCEVARGVRLESALVRLQEFWDVMVYVPTDNAIWSDVEKLLWQMDRAGLQIGAAVLTFDRHFREIPGLQVISDPGLI